MEINILFLEAINEMPKYAQFLKDIISWKRNFLENKLTMMNEEASVVIQRKLPQKLKDPGSFTILCSIGLFYFDKTLCNLGASINLMSLSVVKKFGLGDVKPSFIFQQLARRSLAFPWGILKDVIVKVDQFYIPVDFIVMDMEDTRMPIIFSRPFVPTRHPLIDVEKGVLTLRMGK